MLALMTRHYRYYLFFIFLNIAFSKRTLYQQYVSAVIFIQ